MIKKMLREHIIFNHDLEVIWLLYVLVETDNVQINDPIIQKIIKSRNELAHVILLRKELLRSEEIAKISEKDVSWILLYELYTIDLISEDLFALKLNLRKNLKMYQFLKRNKIHFCSFPSSKKYWIRRLVQVFLKYQASLGPIETVQDF